MTSADRIPVSGLIPTDEFKSALPILKDFNVKVKTEQGSPSSH